MSAEVVVSFAVPFVRGKARPRFARATGHAYTPDATIEAMERLRVAYMAESGGRSAPAGTPVSVTITTARGMPRSRPKRLEQEPDVYKPDADNVAKLVLDALNRVAWADDTQVTSLHVRKFPRDRVADEQTHVIVSWEEDE